MNEYGISSISHHAFWIAFMFLLLSLMPFYEASGGYEFMGRFTDLQISELLFWFFIPFACFVLFYCVGYLISGICCFAVYLVQKAFYVHKLRKPVRLYTGK